VSEPSPGPRETSRPSAPRPPGTLRIGAIAGADVLVSRAWFVVAALLAVVAAPRIEQVEPGLGGWKYVAGAGFALVLCLSVLLHEASHALVARRMGHRVSSITLHALSGRTQIEGETRTAREEFWIAVVGPLVSLLAGACALLLAGMVPDSLLRVALVGLAVVNLIVGTLDLVPGLPLDGGRVLKAAVWQITGSPYRGSVVAGWGGRVVALLVLCWPLVEEQVLGVRPVLVDYLLVLVLAAFLWAGASASLAYTRLQHVLPGVGARALARRALQVPGDVPLSEAVRRAQEAEAGSIVTVGPAGEPVGIVDEAAVLATPVERRPWVPVSAMSRALQPGMSLPADLVGEQLLGALNRCPVPEYLLLEPTGRLYGVLSAADVDRALREAAD